MIHIIEYLIISAYAGRAYDRWGGFILQVLLAKEKKLYSRLSYT